MSAQALPAAESAPPARTRQPVHSELFAIIRKRSKYYGQTAPGAIFPVTFRDDEFGYVVCGNYNFYRLKDVNLFARVVDLHGVEQYLQIAGTKS
jgi:hypothetical protein